MTQTIMAHQNDADIVFEQRGSAGVIMLNRPKAFNALTLAMVCDMRQQLNLWANDTTITRIIIQGAGTKAFCAGGDIRTLYELGKKGQFDQALQFWFEEYQLIFSIKYFPKPIIALISGIVMGGGFGLSGHCTYRVVCDNYLFAMPEVGIGFFPDVGATYVLPRLQSFMGDYLAITGARIGASDALMLGLATHAVQSQHLVALIEALRDGHEIKQTLRKYAAPHQEPTLDKNCAIIHAAFSEPSLYAIIAKLSEFAQNGSDFAQDTLTIMGKNAPLSMAVVVAQMQRGRILDFEDALKLEYAVVSRMGCGLNFYEGVKAAIIDKNYKPQWTPEHIEAIKTDDVEAYFAPIDNELTFL